MENITTPTKQTPRSSNIELLRIFAILGVIILHYNNKDLGGGLAFVQPGTANEYFLYFLESATICAVDLFVMISGYFLCKTKKRNLWKIIELIVQVVAFSVGTYLLASIISGQVPSFSRIIGRLVPANYFVILYSATYLISPFINVILENITRKQFRILVLMSMAMFSAYPTLVDAFIKITGNQWMGLSSISMYGSQSGYTVVNFLLMYLLGAFVRNEADTILRWNGRTLAAVQVLCILGISVWAIVWNGGVAWEYCNPMVILTAVLYLVLFLKWDIPHNKVINRLAEGTFSVFLLHTYFLSYLKIPRFVNAHLLVLFGYYTLSAVLVYLLCWCAHMVYHFVTDRVFCALEKKFSLQMLDW